MATKNFKVRQGLETPLIADDAGITAITLVNGNVTLTKGSQTTKTAAFGGQALDTSGEVDSIIVSGQGVKPNSVYVDNTTSGQLGGIQIREYGQNRPGGVAGTNGVPSIWMESKKGLPSSTGSSFVPNNGSSYAGIRVGGYNGADFTSETGSGWSPNAILFLASESWVNDTASFTGYIGNGVGGASTTLTVTSGTNVHPGLLLSGTGITEGTWINGYGTGTGGAGTYTVSVSQALFTSASPGSFTGKGTKNGGARMVLQSQPPGVKLHASTATGLTSTAAWLNNSWGSAPNASNTVSTPGGNVTVPIPGRANMGFGDAQNGVVLTSADGNTRYQGHGGTASAFPNNNLTISGVPEQDTANVTGYIDNGAGSAGTTLTVSAVISGILSVGQQVYGAGISQLTRITAQTSGTTGGAGTYTVSVSQLAGSSGSQINIVTGPDNYTLLATNSFNVVGSRQSGIPGRRQQIKTGDIAGQMAIWGTKVSNANSYGADTATSNLTARITATATEDFSATAGGSTLTLDTRANSSAGVLGALTTRISTSTTATIFKSDSYTFQTSAGVNSVGNNITYNRVYGQWQNLNLVTPAGSDTAYAFALPTIDFANIASVNTTSRIVPGAAGVYKTQFSVQVRNDDAAAEHIAYFWWRKNGTDVPGSMGRVGIPKAAGAGDSLTIAGWDNMISSANTTDYWELMYAVDDSTHVDFPTFAATAFGPATAALFVTIVPVGA